MKLRTWIGVAAGLGVGYVLGARAGRGRHHQIRESWQEFTESPALQRAVEPVVDATQEIRTGTDDLPEPKGMAALTADQLKERLHRTGTVTDTYHSHLPEEIIKERM
jgi:hypothetical protein